MTNQSAKCGLLFVTFILGLIVKSSTIENNSCSIIDFIDINDTNSCPSWFQPSKRNTCECGVSLPQLIHCNHTDKQSQVTLFACVTYDENKGTVYSGSCPYSQLSANKLSLKSFVSLPTNLTDLNKLMCGKLKRTGLLCNLCEENLGPAVMSYSRECVQCVGVLYGLLIYFAVVIILSTLFCLVMIFTRFDITQASMNAFLLFSQMFSCLVYVFPSVFSNHPSGASIFLISFYGLWNLDFFRALLPPFCISNKMNTLQVVSLDYIVALYPLFFTAVLYYCIDRHDRGCKILVIAWKPFHRFFVCFRRTWSLKGSVINVFASLLLLSYSKLLSVSAVMLIPTTVYNGCGDRIGIAPFFDASVEYFQMRHFPYMLLAVVVIIVVIVFPIFFILFFPCKLFQKYLCHKKLRITLLCELAKVRHKSFKDGSNGTCDYRSFAAFYLIIRVCFFICTLIRYGPVLSIFITGLASVLIALMRPYKENFFNIFDSLFFFLATFLTAYGVIIYSGVYPRLPFAPLAVFCTIPFIYFVFLFILKVLKITKLLTRCKLVMCKVKEEEIVPHRLLHSSEYSPLLPKVEESM